MTGQSEGGDDELVDGIIGRGEYTVELGDGMNAIADATGHFWKTIWDDPENAELKEARGNPETLLPGDKITIPALRSKQESRPVDQTHRFKRKGVPVKIEFKVATQGGKTFAGKDYSLRIGKRVYEGVTDDEGRLEHWVTPSSSTGELTVALDTDGFPETGRWSLNVGGLPPADTALGLQTRLKNLGYDCGALDGVMGDGARAALAKFQTAQNLEATGVADATTIQRLSDTHGA